MAHSPTQYQHSVSLSPSQSLQTSKLVGSRLQPYIPKYGVNRVSEVAAFCLNRLTHRRPSTNRACPILVVIEIVFHRLWANGARRSTRHLWLCALYRVSVVTRIHTHI